MQWCVSLVICNFVVGEEPGVVSFVTELESFSFCFSPPIREVVVDRGPYMWPVKWNRKRSPFMVLE